MSKKNITSLPHIAGDEITRLLSPLSRANLGRALASAGVWFNFRKDYKQPAKFWDIIFKDEIWLQTVSGLYYEYTSPPNPVMVGSDLVKPYYGASRSPVYLALVISDWGGDARYEKEKLFASFREQDYDFYKDLSEVRFKKSGIILHIGDAIKSEEWIKMKDPSRLFRRYKKELWTAALYYHDDHLCQIGPDQIGGIEDFSTKKKKRVKYICSVRLRFGNGDPVYRVMKGYNLPIKLVGKQTEDENKRKWVASWRLARAGEREWSVV
jgi:hypothetical protein